MSRNQVLLVVALVIIASALTLVITSGSGEDTESVDDPTSTGSTAAVSTSTVSTGAAPTSTTTTTTSTTSTSTTTTLQPGVAELQAVIEQMSLVDKARQLVVSGASGRDPGAAIEAVAGSLCVGGVFVSKNVDNWTPATDLEAATAAIATISERAAGCVIRPFITTDAEAGTLVLKVPVSPLPEPSTLEANHGVDPATTSEGLAESAVAFAAELAGAGVHVNLGVIADVDVGDDFYMARQRRSFGGDPATVAAITDAIVEGHCRSGVASTLKHFPNQGSTIEDPHRLDSVSANDQAAWADAGRVPYVDTRSPLVMTGHIRYAGVDDAIPASLSHEITTGWLREGLAYEGVIITDDLHGMRGITDELPAAARGAAAVAAGADLALYVDDSALAGVIDEIVARAESDSEFAARVDESVERVVRLKAALGLVDGLDPAWFDLC